MTIDAEFGKGITLETGHVMPGTVPGRGHPGDCRLFPQVQGLGGCVTLEPADMLPQVKGLGGGITLKTVDR